VAHVESSPSLFDEPRKVSLTRLAGEVARAVGAIGKVAVEGEVVKPWFGGNGLVMFTLKDRNAVVTVRCPAGRRARCRVVAGERVQVTGRPEWVPERGQLQLLADEVVPVGEGAIAAMIAETRARLERDGLLDRPRRRIPRLPQRIGVVCGTDAAVQADIESVVAARFPGYPITFVPTLVTGSAAADAIIRSVQVLDEAPDVEVIILARGGGDGHHLLPWSDEALCRVLCSLSTPVVSAIGHEGDRPLCDDVADLRCGTPSLAASAVVPDLALLVGELRELRARVDDAARRRVELAGARLAAIDREGALRAGMQTARRRLERAGDRLELLHPNRLLATARDRLAAEWRQVEALSPVRVLERGYAVVRRAAGSVVRSAADVAVGEALDVQVAAGRMTTRVEETTQ
jgi:exodeoxyribonuclease VII large subunit